MKKLMYLSNIAVPQQVKFAEALSNHFETRFIFYEYPDRTRGSWWRVELGQSSKVLKDVHFFSRGPVRERYIAFDLLGELESFQPDYLIIGGLSIPSNYMAYRWAKNRGKKVVLFSERSRDKKGVLRKKSFVWTVLRRLYADLDLVIVSAADAVDQFKVEFGFGDKVVAGRYASDLDEYFSHESRSRRDAYVYLFANRLTEIYGPIKAIEIFHEVLISNPGSKLVMNTSGELYKQCVDKIDSLGIAGSVEFLTNLKSWADLGDVYKRCDILLLPALFSNGNFSVLEAMASGMGVVVSNKVMGMGDYLIDGKTGFVCDPDVSQFVTSINRYISNPALFGSFSEFARDLVRPLGAEGTARFYRDLLSEKFGS